MSLRIPSIGTEARNYLGKRTLGTRLKSLITDAARKQKTFSDLAMEQSGSPQPKGYKLKKIVTKYMPPT